jgi:hypothetical protein
MGDVTRDELRDLRNDIVGRMTDGFSGVHTRLDTLNGRTSKGEVAIAAADVRMTNLEREVFRRRRVGSVDADDTGTPRVSASRAFGQREVQIFLAGGGALIAAWKFVEWAVHVLRQIG